MPDRQPKLMSNNVVIQPPTGEQNIAVVNKVKRRLRELGAPPELVRQAQESWLGTESQALKTFKKLHGYQ